MIHNMVNFYSEELLAPRPISKLEDQLLLAVCNCFFNIFTATLYFTNCSSIHNLLTYHAMVKGIHLSCYELWPENFIFKKDIDKLLSIVSINGLFSPASKLSSQDETLHVALQSTTSYLNSARYISEGATWWAWLFEVKADGIVGGGWSCFLSYCLPDCILHEWISTAFPVV